MKFSYGRQEERGIAINYNPDYHDVSFHLWKWWAAIGVSVGAEEQYEGLIAELQPMVMRDGEDLGLDLPAYVVDVDFFEFLQEESADNSVDVIEMLEYFDEWMKEECE